MKEDVSGPEALIFDVRTLVSDNQMLFVFDNQIPKLGYDLLKQINASRFQDFSINNSH